MQLMRENSLLETQERSDVRRKQELQALSTEIAETRRDDPVNANKYTNFRDARPVAQAKRAQKKIAEQ